MLFTCKQVSKALADQDYESLSFSNKLMLRLHVTLCAICGQYNRQMMDLHDGVRTLRAQEDEERLNGSTGLSEEQKERLRQAIDSSNAA